MSAYCYIQLSDVPPDLMKSIRRRVDDVSGESLVAFDDSPLVGLLGEGDEEIEIEYPFPRSTIRNDLVSWLVHWGICFRVVM
jgi:hypothetical protein